jgi:SAM-dependent methyltransferase
MDASAERAQFTLDSSTLSASQPERCDVDHASNSSFATELSALATPRLPRRTTRDRSQFLSVLRRHVQHVGLDAKATVLVVGGMQEDAQVLRDCGFHSITLSNIQDVSNDLAPPADLPIRALDAEDIRLPDESYDVVMVHEVIHHCRSPHRALCELLRVARRVVIMMEPNDSGFMKLLCKLRFSLSFETFAVVDNDYVCGGVRNTPIPNYIYRWNEHEVHKVASSFLAEHTFDLHVYPYWDLNIDERGLAYREQTRISRITDFIGTTNFIRFLHVSQRILNRIPILRRQGNKFFCCLAKNKELRPWLLRDNKGTIAFDRNFQRRLD